MNATAARRRTPQLIRSATTLASRLFGSRWRAALWVAIVFNVVLASLYLWSRSGGETAVRLEAEGQTYRAYVDGKLQVEAFFPEGPEAGGIGLELFPQGVSSLPGPHGVDNVRVTRRDGTLLFEDSFDQPSDRWEVSGQWASRDSVYAPSSRGSLFLPAASWTDYTVEVEFKNVSSAAVGVLAEGPRDGVSYRLRPYRHYDNGLRLLDDGATVASKAGPRVELDRSETVRSMLSMLLRPYPTVLAVIAVLVVAGFAARRSHWTTRVDRLGAAITRNGPLIVGALALTAFGVLLYIIYFVGDHMPHVPDSVAYVFQSKIFATLRVAADVPPARESFSFFNPNFMLVAGDRWFTQYPFGHPIALTPGQVFDAPWLIPPLLGAASVYLIWRVGAHLYGTAVGLLAAILLAASPFFEMTASNLMSHNTSVFYILVLLLLVVRPSRHRELSMLAAGAFLGLLFNTRPLTGVLLMPPLGLLFAYDFARATSPRRELIGEYAAFSAGALLLLGAYFAYNGLTTGSFLESPYAASGTFAENTFGFGGRHSVAVGMQNQQVLLSLFLLVINGWPVVIGAALALMPFVLGTTNKWDYFLAGAFLFVAGGSMLYVNPAIMHGPRFWYELTPFFILLSARGAQVLITASTSRGWWSKSTPLGGADRGATSGVSLVVYSAVAVLVGVSVYSWTFGQRDAWRGITFVPENAAALDGFNAVDDGLLDLADEEGLTNALVFVDQCRHWQCYGTVFWTNSPDLDGDVVWAEAQGNSDDLTVLEAFPDRKVYRARYPDELQRVSRAQIAASAQAPGQRETPPTARSQTPEQRDLTRRQDLATIESALYEYESLRGAFPDTDGGRQSVCRFRTLDVACALLEVVPDLPTDPLEHSGRTYWLVSTDDEFVLIAVLEAAAETAPACPQPVIDKFDSEAVLYCVTGGASGEAAS